MKKKIIIIIVGVIFVVAIGYAVNRGEPKQAGPASIHDAKLQVVTSFYPLYFFTSQIAGDKAVVFNVTPAAAEPHDYEPTAQDIARIEDSQLLILNGGKFEPWGDQVQAGLQGKNVVVLSVGDEFANRSVVEDGVSIHDPHVWLDPSFAKKEVATIAQALEKIDPANTATFEANAATLNAKLDALDQQYRQGLRNCVKKDIITSHVAFVYLARAYGLNQVPISGVSPDAEPSAQQLAVVADFAKKNNVKYIFFESLVSPKLAETIAHEVGAQTLVLNPIEGLTEEEIAEGKDYFTEMKNNLANLRVALECQ